LWNMYSYS